LIRSAKASFSTVRRREIWPVSQIFQGFERNPRASSRLSENLLGSSTCLVICSAKTSFCRSSSATLAVTSRQVVRLLFEQRRLQFVPVLHRLQGGLAAQS